MSNSDSDDLDDSGFQILSSSQPTGTTNSNPNLPSSTTSNEPTATSPFATNTEITTSETSNGFNNPAPHSGNLVDPESHKPSSRKPIRIELDNDEDGDDEVDEDEVSEVVVGVNRSVRKRVRHVEDTDSDSEEIEAINIDDLDDDDDDDEIIILGSDGETAETTKTTAELLKEQNNSTLTLKQAKCSICLDEVEKCVALPCGHFYCAECIYQAMASSKVSQRLPDTGICALCRKRIKYKDLVWLKFRIKKKTDVSSDQAIST